MTSKQFIVSQQLLDDTHALSVSSGYHVLLHKNATIPWVILVPIIEVKEIYELPQSMQTTLLKLQKLIANYFQIQFNTKKMNIAAIGNIVSQLHIHIVGRKPTDACWPDVVWGNEYAFTEYSKEKINHITSYIKGL